MYHLDHVTKTYQQRDRSVQALKDVSLHIGAGEFFSIQGPTGGGKSTLLQLLGTLDRATSGTVRIGDTDISSATDKELAALRAEKIGFVFQGFNLIPTLTAIENVQLAFEPLGLPAATVEEKALLALESVGLGQRATHLPSELSGGQQQRVAIARAIAKEPQVLLADEPTGNLDEHTRDEIMVLLESLWKTRGLTVVLVTHDSQVAERAQRHLFIQEGTVSELGRNVNAAGAGRSAPQTPVPAAGRS